jgi:HAD superfamily hydrolase (TIGR01509 family)
MNIIIPIGGKGERFSKQGYNEPKPLISIMDKLMIEYVLDNLTIREDDQVFILYNHNLEKYNFKNFISDKYKQIIVISIPDTKGAVETLRIGLDIILERFEHHNKSIILDCDTFYTEDIISTFRESTENLVFYTINKIECPIYSYIALDESERIVDIKEKVKISHNANTGAYAFIDINELYKYCIHVLDNGICFKGEPYTSCVISEMINSNTIFYGKELDARMVFSLGTPEAVELYKEHATAFLFDLDGTLVITDNIYYEVWHKILSVYNIDLTCEMFKAYIQGNNDRHVINSLLSGVNINLTELSNKKDELFIENISKIQIICGVIDILNDIKVSGNKACIVTNCNKRVANAILNYTNLDGYIDFIISNDDCKNGKPSGEPYALAMKKYNISPDKCVIFEDSKTGIISGKMNTPRLLIGIETIYSSTELVKCGADITISNYVDMNVSKIGEIKNGDNENLKDILACNLKCNADAITINNCKLKGGFIADVIGFEVSGNKYILKYENKTENNLSNMAKQLELYNREYYFYANIARFVDVEVPKFSVLIKNNNFENVGIALENLNTKNCIINLNLNVENIEISLKIVNRMAKLHSKFWNKDLKRAFPDLKTSVDKIMCPFMHNFISERHKEFIARWVSINRIVKFEKVFDDFTDIQRRFSIGNNLTLIHGDIKSPNIFYDTNNDNEPCFIDWQHCAIGKGVQDLIFFIIESFDICKTKQIFYLMKHYYYLKLIDYGIVNYSFEEYERDIYDAVRYIPFFTCVWFGSIQQDELIDKNFPYFLITKTCLLMELTA